MVTTIRQKREGGRRATAKKTERLLVRLDADEKDAFESAALLAGMPLSGWVRVRLRWAATKELQEQGREVAFLQTI